MKRPTRDSTGPPGKADLVALAPELQYLRLYTTRGGALILHSLREAMQPLAKSDGIQGGHSQLAIPHARRLGRPRRGDGWTLSRGAVAAAALTLVLLGRPPLAAHDEGARFVQDLGWTTDQIARTVAAEHVLGLGAEPSARGVTVAGRRCVEGGVVAFDVADGFAFDVDEEIELEILFAAPGYVRFDLAYDANGTTRAIRWRTAGSSSSTASTGRESRPAAICSSPPRGPNAARSSSASRSPPARAGGWR